MQQSNKRTFTPKQLLRFARIKAVEPTSSATSSANAIHAIYALEQEKIIRRATGFPYITFELTRKEQDDTASI